MSPEEKRRLAYIEGRDDLFQTKFFRIGVPKEHQKEADHSLLATMRDPGSAAALAPVLESLQSDTSLEMIAATDGRAEEIVKKRFTTEDITPTTSAFEIAGQEKTPDVILVCASSENGIETFASTTFSEKPVVVVEDYYTSAGNYLQRLKEIQEGSAERELPQAICVMDEEAKRIVVDAYPDVEPLVVVTGQPAFDRIARENTETISKTVRERLELDTEQKLVTFMSQMQPKEMAEDLAQALRHATSKFVLAFRRHPRDPVPAAEYREVLEKAGIALIDTDDFSTDEISAASDLILTAFSTAGLEGIYRRKPTIHITDTTHQEIPAELPLPLPPVKLGASVGVDHMADLSAAVDALLDNKSALHEQIAMGMETFYPRDGKNAERVAAVVYDVLRRTTQS